MISYDWVSSFQSLTWLVVSVLLPGNVAIVNRRRRLGMRRAPRDHIGAQRDERSPGGAVGGQPRSWARADWLRFADGMLTAARRHASPGHALIFLPGPEGGYGRAIDGLEGFARTFLLAGFRIAGRARCRARRSGDLVRGRHRRRHRRRLTGALDPTGRTPAGEGRGSVHRAGAGHDQALDLGPALSRACVSGSWTYLAPAVGDPTYPRINWVWFRAGRADVPTLRRRSVVRRRHRRGPRHARHVPARRRLVVRRARARLRPLHRLGAAPVPDAVGAHGRAPPTSPAAATAATSRRSTGSCSTRSRLVGGDGSPLLQGRSLIYRFAAAAPFWVGALAGVPVASPGRLRNAAERSCGTSPIAARPTTDGLLTIGWHGAWPRLAQAYSGPGSPYWASKGLLGIALPADHPVWTSPAEPLPVQRGDTLRAVRAPGWIVGRHAADGIVRVVNHGTDHATGAPPSPTRRCTPASATPPRPRPLLDDAGVARARSTSPWS